MAEVQLSEANTYPAQSYLENFFAQLPTDQRFTQVTYHKIMPRQSIEGTEIEFVLEKFDGPNIYQIQDTIMELRIKILKADGTKPDTDKQVAPRNNVLHTVFDKLSMYINDTPITKSDQFYAYKAYIINTLTYDRQVKNSHLQSQGYFPDSAGHFDSLDEARNSGGYQRSNYFRKDGKKDSEYRENGASFIGRIYHDLVNCETGLIPNTRVKFVFEKNKNSFILMSGSTDEEKYKIEIANICLYVPVAQLALPIYNELNLMMSHKESKPIAIQFRRIEIRPYSIPLSAQEWWSPSLFSEADLPCRLICFFVLTSAKVGDYHSNPFNFNRNWETTTSSLNVPLRSDDWDIRVRNLEQVVFLQNKLLTKSQDSTRKRVSTRQQNKEKQIKVTKGKAKANVKATSNTPQISINSSDENSSHSDDENLIREEADRRLRQYLTSLKQSAVAASGSEGNCQASTSRHSDILSENELEAIYAPKKKNIYLKKLELYLNQTLVDQIAEDQTEDECINTYFRMFNTNGQANSLFTSAISYDEFKKGYFFSCYDLTTSNKSGTNYVIPSIRVGHLRLRVEFSEPQVSDLTLMAYCEYPSTLFLHKDGKVTVSYSPR